MFDAAPILDPVPLQQSEAFARALTSVGRAPLRLDEGTLLLRRKIAGVPLHMMTRPRAANPDALLDRINLANIRGPMIVAPDSPMPLDQIGALPLVSPSTLAVLDLSISHDDLMSNMHQKWRNRLRHAQQQGLRMTRQNMPDDPTHWLLAADIAQQGKRKYRSWPREVTLAYARENPGDAKLFSAFWGREPVAAILVLRNGGTATYHIGHSRASGRVVSAHTLLLWNAFTWAKSKGVTRFELGTIDTENAAGLARFKLGSGARPHRLGGSWLYWPPVTSLLRPVARLDRRLMQDT